MKFQLGSHPDLVEGCFYGIRQMSFETAVKEYPDALFTPGVIFGHVHYSTVLTGRFFPADVVRAGRALVTARVPTHQIEDYLINAYLLKVGL